MTISVVDARQAINSENFSVAKIVVFSTALSFVSLAILAFAA